MAGLSLAKNGVPVRDQLEAAQLVTVVAVAGWLARKKARGEPLTSIQSAVLENWTTSAQVLLHDLTAFERGTIAQPAQRFLDAAAGRQA